MEHFLAALIPELVDTDGGLTPAIIDYLAVARERRAADDADDHREIVDDCRRQASARIDELGNQGGEEVLQPALLSHARRKGLAFESAFLILRRKSLASESILMLPWGYIPRGFFVPRPSAAHRRQKNSMPLEFCERHVRPLFAFDLRLHQLWE